MGCNVFLCWACAKIRCSLDEHAQKLVARWLGMRKNWFLIGWAYAKIISEHHIHFQSSSIPPVILSSVPFSHPCLPSYVPCLWLFSHPMSPVLRICSLSPIFCSLSNVSDPSLTSSVRYVSRDLSPVSHPASLYPNPYHLSQWPLFCGSLPLFLSFVPLFSHPLFLRLFSSIPCLSYNASFCYHDTHSTSIHWLRTDMSG